MAISDPWRTDPTYQVPPVGLWLTPLIEQSGDLIKAWSENRVA